MNEFTLSELGLFVGTLGGVLVSLIFAIQKSKCDTISCCGLKCHRKIPPDQPDNGRQLEDPAPVERPVNHPPQNPPQENPPPANP